MACMALAHRSDVTAPAGGRSWRASSPRPRVRDHRWARRRGVAGPILAAERAGGYDAGPVDVDAPDTHGPDTDGPDTDVAGVDPVDVDAAEADLAEAAGVPVLAELPALADLLDDLRTADRAMSAAVARLADLTRSGEVERTTGVGVEHWMAAVARQTRMDRRLLRRACRLLHRLPSLDAAVRDGRVSFAQLRGIAIALRSLPTEVDAELDAVVAALLDGLQTMERPDPDVLVRQIDDAADELHTERLADAERDAVAGRHLWLQPHLDGSGGRFGGQLDAAGLALLDAATTPPDALLDQPGGLGTARADTLLARLAGAGPDDADPDGAIPHPADTPPPPIGDVAPWWDRLGPPKLLMRLSFDTLLDQRIPADLLTSLLGGRLRLTSAAAAELADRRGALLRTIVIDDDGAAIGVGRATRRPPGWLRDAIAAIHDTCSEPGCDRPARGADHDHARPWWPTGPDQRPGHTDLAELGPLCDATNRDKEAAGWKVRQTAAGIRTWHHPRSGLTTTTVPATWRPPDDPRRRRPPPRSAPPGADDPGPAHADRPSPGRPGGTDAGQDGLPF